jgi:hypothetical protein
VNWQPLTDEEMRARGVPDEVIARWRSTLVTWRTPIVEVRVVAPTVASERQRAHAPGARDLARERLEHSLRRARRLVEARRG